MGREEEVPEQNEESKAEGQEKGREGAVLAVHPHRSHRCLARDPIYLASTRSRRPRHPLLPTATRRKETSFFLFCRFRVDFQHLFQPTPVGLRCPTCRPKYHLFIRTSPLEVVEICAQSHRRSKETNLGRRVSSTFPADRGHLWPLHDVRLLACISDNT